MQPSLRLTIGADHREVARVNAAFAEFADAHQVPAAVRRSMSVVLDELLTNAIAHGFRGRAGGEVTVAAELFPDRLSVTVTDNGKPFDPFGVPEPDTTLSTAERPIGGLGVHLAKRMMDDVRYQREADRNVVIFEKRLRAQ